MNEVMQALEAMIRRIVNEELADPSKDKLAEFALSLKGFADTCGPEWAAIVSQGALDKPWFDNAVKAEVAAESTSSTYGTDFYTAVRDAVINDSAIHDHLVSKIEEFESDVFGQKIDSYIERNYDFDDICQSAVRDMSFSVTVD